MKVYVDKGKLESHDIQSITDLGGKEFQQVRMWFKDTDNVEILSLADHTKRVRKEVLGELMNMLGDRAELIDCGGVAEFMFTTYDLSMCVEEILGEEKGETECQKN